MNSAHIFTVIFSCIACLSAILVAMSKKMVHSLLFLMLSAFGMSGLFITLGIEILAVISMILYIALASVMLMIIYPLQKREAAETFRLQFILGSVVTLVLCGLLIYAGKSISGISAMDVPDIIHSGDFARYTVGEYYIPIGMSAFLLIAVLVGAFMTIGRRKN